MNEEQSIEERILRRIPFEIGLLALVLAVPVGIIFGTVTAFLFFVGGIFGAISFVWMKQSVYRFTDGENQKAIRSIIIHFSLRLLLIIGIVFIIILLFSKKVIAFVAGFSTLILVFFVEAVGALLKFKQWKS